MLPPTFLEFRGRWNITLDLCLQGMGEGKGDPQWTPHFPETCFWLWPASVPAL